MSQMGGWAILDYALYYAADPFPYLRLGYGSLLSSWALLNSGREETGWGWRFPGREHDGAASGGFEPLYLGKTWLEQPHHGGAWYYSCEIDLGFCGYLRGAATVYALDPLFGPVCLGGRAEEPEGVLVVLPEDGVQRRFHLVTPEARLHLLCDRGRLERVELDTARGELRAVLNLAQAAGPARLVLTQTVHPQTEEEMQLSDEREIPASGSCTFSIHSMIQIKE